MILALPHCQQINYVHYNMIQIADVLSRLFLVVELAYLTYINFILTYINFMLCLICTCVLLILRVHGYVSASTSILAIFLRALHMIATCCAGDAAGNG